MDFRTLTDGLSVGAQIAAGDLAAIRAAGFRSVICNRPDGESADQPTHEEIGAAASAAGLGFRHLPVTPGALTDETIEAFGTALLELPGPVLAYCRSGTRSATLWALSEAGRRPVPGILAAARAAGYDLSGLSGRLAEAEAANANGSSSGT